MQASKIRRMSASPAVVVLLSSVALLLAGCGGESPDGRSYTSTAVSGREIVRGTALSLEFEDGDVLAKAGCNDLYGPYTLIGGTLVAELGTTQMGCPDGVGEQEEWFGRWLGRGVDADVDDDRLTLSSADVTVVFERSD